MAGVPAPVVARRKNREKLAWGIAAAALLGMAALGYGFVRRAPKPPRLARFEIAIPPGITALDAPKISPDGKILAFNATDANGKTQIWLRPLNALTAQPLPGTEGTRRPFWSPDSRFLGFVADGKLKKIDVTGGPPTKICDAPSGVDGSWSPEGVILYDGTGPDPIYRVSAAGGTPVVAAKLDTKRKEVQIGWPEFLPDGRHFLYMAMTQKPEDSAYRIGSLDSAETKPLAPAQTMLAYAPPGLPPLRAGQDAGGRALRREGAEDHRRGGSPGRTDRYRCRRVGAVLGLARRGARVPDRRDGRSDGLDRPVRQGARDDRRKRGVSGPSILARGRPIGLRLHRSPDRKVGHLDSRSGARRELTVHVRAGQRVLRRLVSERRRDRLRVRPRRGSGALSRSRQSGRAKKNS